MTRPTVDSPAAVSPTRLVFHGVFVIVIAIHVATGVFALYVARLYHFISTSSMAAAHFYYFLGGDMLRYSGPVIAVSAATAVLHALMVFRITWNSLRARALVFSSLTSNNPDTAKRRSSWLSRLVTTTGHYLDHFWRLIGVTPFELELLVELAVQTFQANKLSQLVSTIWINRLLVVIIVANCWSTPLVHRVLLPQKPKMQRELVCLLVDSVLDLVYFTVIPIAIFLPYAQDYSVSKGGFSFINYYRDEWQVNAVAENRQVFITSWLDLVSKMLPGLSLLLRLSKIQTLFTETRSRRSLKIEPTLVLLVPSSTALVQTKQVHSSLPAKTTGSLPTKRRVLHIVFACWGAAVLGLHLFATMVALRGVDTGCILELRPWASTAYTCVVLEVSCSQKQVYGRADEVDDPLSRVDPQKLQGLVLSNCPQLHMPQRFQTFPVLMLLKIHNSTITEWDERAAITAESHPSLQLVYISETNMSSIPIGLRSPSLPPTFYDLEICGTNLTELPDDLAEVWQGIGIFLLELAPNITVAPRVIGQLPILGVLSLSSTGITSIPDTLLVNATFLQVALASMPLTQLPEHVGSLQQLNYMDVVGTPITTLPASWLTRETTPGVDNSTQPPTINLFAAGTNLCDPTWQEQVGVVASTAEDLVGTVGWFHLRCHPAVIARPYYYPLQEERAWREGNRYP